MAQFVDFESTGGTECVELPPARVVRRVPFTGAGAAPPELLGEREWLVTNGLGGYASGTIIGAITRRYHGLLIAALPAPLGRVVMLNQLTENLQLPDGTQIELSSGLGFHEGVETPSFAALTEFRLENGLPVWRYQIDGHVLEKSIFMAHGRNSTYLIYRLIEGDGIVRLKLSPHVQFRLHENSVNQTSTESYSWTAMRHGFEIRAAAHPPLRFSVSGREWSFCGFQPRVENIFYRAEQQRGYEAFGELCSFGVFEAEIERGAAMTLVASAEAWESIVEATPRQVCVAEYARRKALLGDVAPSVPAELVLAADAFIVAPVYRSRQPQGDRRRTIIAGYHWFTDWGRDTMISLEGLTLLTRRYDEARGILENFSEHIKDGLIPNLFPEGEERGCYNTADATLWFFHALDRYVEITGDRALLRRLLPKLRDIVEHHLHGTLFGIGVDPDDGLLRQGQEGVQLTWMDAKVGDWVVTPRRGKAVEINALWYNALRLLEGWLREAGDSGGSSELAGLAERAQKSFNNRFWDAEHGYLFDVVDCENQPGVNDSACRPNQLIAISLRHSALVPERWRAVLDVVRERLLTPYGLRSLAPDHPDYKARYFGDLRARDAAYHQGTVWAWLIGPFIDAWLKVYPEACEQCGDFLAAFNEHLGEACIGTISEVFDAEAPFTARGCAAQAWSVAEVLRVWVNTAGAEKQGALAVSKEPAAPLTEEQIDEAIAESFPASTPPRGTSAEIRTKN
jgi:predicted glycogen debranching enzyme